MAVAHRASTTADMGVDTTFTCNKPAGTTTNDVMVMAIYYGDTPPENTITAPSGWTKLTSVQLANNTVFLELYWKRAGGSEGASYSWTWTGAVTSKGGIACFSGADTTTAIDVEGSGNTGSSASPTALSVTTATANAMLVFAAANDFQSLATPPTGFAEAFDLLGIEVAYVIQASAGASGNKNSTITSDQWGAKMIALRPVAAGGTTAVSRLMLLGVG